MKKTCYEYELDGGYQSSIIRTNRDSYTKTKEIHSQQVPEREQILGCGSILMIGIHSKA